MLYYVCYDMPFLLFFSLVVLLRDFKKTAAEETTMPPPPIQMLHEVFDNTNYNRCQAKSQSRRSKPSIVSFLISAPAVALFLIIWCSLLGMEPTKARTTGWSRTRGGLGGECRVTS